jgi:DNA transformation protein
VDPDDIHELFSAFGPVTVRRMFSGAGVFRDGLMFALVTRGVVHLKADAETIPGFAREGCGPFTYATRQGERTLPSYWRMPDRLYDDIDELGVWASAAFAAAGRAAMAKGAKRPSKPRLPPSRGRSRK